jgi:hypothetical protein
MNTIETEFFTMYNLLDNDKQLEIINLFNNLLDLKVEINKYKTIFDIKFDPISKTFLWKNCEISILKKIIVNIEFDKSNASKYQTGC